MQCRLTNQTVKLAGGFTDYTDTSTARPLPKGYVMRYVNVLEPITGTKRKINIGSVAATAFAVGGTILLQSFMPGATGTVAFDILSAIGERALSAYAGDTGLTDGDAT